MKLTDGERLIIAMLCDIYKSGNVKGDIDPEFVASSILGRNEWGLKWKYPNLFLGDDDAPAVVRETCDILEMYAVLTPSFEALSEADQARLCKTVAPFEAYVRYQGFDHDSDPHAWIVRYLVEKLGRYAEVANPELNSASFATLAHYRTMLSRFQQIDVSTLPRHQLSPGQMIGILKPKK
jgi:uncharacterized protein